MATAPLVILSGPSGSGKSTVIRELTARGRVPLRHAVSATTRPPRPGEEDGRHYHFWERSRFEAGIVAGEFLEYAVVHGNLYGTPLSELDAYRERGVAVVLDIDVQGYLQVRGRCPGHVSIFLHVPDGDYEARLRARGTESEEAIARRLETARRELPWAGEYMHQIVNDDLERTVTQVERWILERYFTGETDAG